MSLLLLFFLAFIPYATSITFDLDFRNSTQDIILLGDANFISNKLNLVDTDKKNTTSRGSQLGRATYFKRLHLWDKVSNDLASFSTTFEFYILGVEDVVNEGLTFFLAEDNSVMYGGGSIGLPFDNLNNNGVHPFVAVEFDTHGNDSCDPYDPVTDTYIGNHVGININSTTSVVYGRWSDDISKGGFGSAEIEYHSDSKVLSVSFLSFRDSGGSKVELNYTVDLRNVLPEWVIFGFSAAVGVDASPVYDNVDSWAFNSTKIEGSFEATAENTTQSSSPPVTTNQNADNWNNTAPGSSPPLTMNKNAENKTGLVVGLIVGLLVVVTILSVLLYVCWGKMNYKHTRDKLEEPVRRFSYQELAISTGMFADTEKLGSVGSGAFYKGFLKDSNKHVAVKRVYNTSIHDFKQYSSEIKILSQSTHQNLVPLVGWCHEEHELLLLYEYFEKGSLDLHLFKRENPLTWNTRFIIARGLASALICLHEELDPCVLHRDIKSSNVMVDSNFKARLGDFGFSKLVNHENNMIAGGTVGYIAPEYLATGKASKKSDVFSFGVVALEIASGRSAIEVRGHGETNLVNWVWDQYCTEKLLEVADPRLDSKFAEEEMTRLVSVGLWCTNPVPKNRPSMRQAFQVLNSEAPLPTL